MKGVKNMSFMTRETIEKLPLFLSLPDLIDLGFSRGMIQNTIFKDESAGVIKIGKKRMVQRDEFFEWLERQKISDGSE